MNFSFSDEQLMLRDTVARFLSERYTFDNRRRTVSQEPGWSQAIWKSFAEELAILGAPFSKEYGGLGGGALETMIIMQELGKALVIEPYVSTVVIAGGFLRHSEHERAAELIEKIAAGEAIFAFAYAEPQGRYNLAEIQTRATQDGSGWRLNGRKAAVMAGAWASHLIVTARTSGTTNDHQGISVFIVPRDAPGVTSVDFATVDGSRASEITFANVVVGRDAIVGPEGESLPLIQRVVDEAIVATCAEACGVLQQMLDDTIDYTKGRKQFGVPIASFQVLQHRMVDMHIQIQQSLSTTLLATTTLSDENHRSKAVSAAKVKVGRTCTFVGENAIQLHGAMGITDEMPISHYFRRSTMIESAFGSTDHHLARYESFSFDALA